MVSFTVSSGAATLLGSSATSFGDGSGSATSTGCIGCTCGSFWNFFFCLLNLEKSKHRQRHLLGGGRVLMYPVSFLKALTEFRRKRFGISEPGDEPFSLQSGHSLSSDSSSAVRTPI